MSINAIVANTAEIAEKITVYRPPMKNPTQRKTAVNVNNIMVDIFINTSYNLIKVLASSFLEAFPYDYRFLFRLVGLWERFFFLFLKVNIKAIVDIVQLQKLKKVDSQSFNSNLTTSLKFLYILYHTNSSMSTFF